MAFKFNPLALALGPWFEKRVEELPVDIRLMLKSAEFSDALWDEFTPEARRDATARWDYQHDPAKESERDEYSRAWETPRVRIVVARI